MTSPTPAIPSFTDGVVVNAAALNGLGANLTNLYNYSLGGFRTSKPQVEVRLTNTGFSLPNNTETVVNWDVADVNTDTMWSSSAATKLTVSTAGTYFLYGQAVHTGPFSTYSVRLLVNGTTPSSNAVGSFQANANGGNVSAVVALAANATVYLSVLQTSGSAQVLATTYGGSRLAAYWIGP